jgi:hypothetical protein
MRMGKIFNQKYTEMMLNIMKDSKVNKFMISSQIKTNPGLKNRRITDSE